MSCTSCYQSVAVGLQGPTGVPAGAVVGGAAHCPHCGGFLDAKKLCHNPKCPGAQDASKDASATAVVTLPSGERFSVAPLIGEALTPITPDLPERALKAGQNGVGLVLGGDDVEDLNATWYTYRAGDTTQSLLVCKVRADLPLQPGLSSAEDKLLSALDLQGETQFKTVQVAVTKVGQLPPDQKHQLGEKLVLAAKSLGYHFGEAGDGVVKPYVEENIASVELVLDDLESQEPPDGVSGGELTNMTGHYRKVVNNLKAVIEAGKEGGGKDLLMWVEPYAGKYTAYETKKVPVPPEVGQVGLPAVKEQAEMPDIHQGRWNGWSPESGECYRIALGDDWQALYYPHQGQGPVQDSTGQGVAVPYALQGTLMVVPPAGADDAGQAVAQLRRLNLHGYLSSEQDAEYVYLNRNAWAMGLGESAGYKKIASGQGQDEEGRGQAVLDEMVDRLDPQRVAAMAPTEQEWLAQDMLLRAQHRVKLERIGPLRELLAGKLGTTPGELAQSPHYFHHTTGQVMLPGGDRQAGGFRVWHRLGAGQHAHPNRRIGHNLTGDGWQNLIKCIEGGGVLYCTARRKVGGIGAGDTMSQSEDMASGGGSYVFTRVYDEKHAGAPHIVWDYDTLAQRSDWFAYNGDHFGAINPHDGHWKGHCYTTDPDTAAQFTASNNEVMFKNGISLLDYPPVAINTPTAAKRKKVLAAFAKMGITHLGGRAVDEIVK